MVRAVTQKEAAALKAEGWKACDLHVHTSASHDVFSIPKHSPKAVYAEAKARGMDFVVFTDHDTFASHNAFQAKDLITGCEFRICDKTFVGHSVHVNVYAFSKAQYAKLQATADAGSLRQFVRLCKKLQLPFQFNHPIWAEQKETLHITSIPKVARLFPVLEINAKRVRIKNDLTLMLARSLKKGVSMGSDSHIGEPGRVYTLAQGRTFKEWFSNVAKGNAVIVRKDMSINSFAHEIAASVAAACSGVVPHSEFDAFKRKWHSGSWFVDRLVLLFIASRKYRLGRYATHLIAGGLAHSRIPSAIYMHREMSSGRSVAKKLAVVSSA